MTTHGLYEIYRGAYAEASHFETGPVPVPLGRRLRELLSAERAIAELGRDDATNGRPMRSAAEFERALRHARRLLAGLGPVAPAGT